MSDTDRLLTKWIERADQAQARADRLEKALREIADGKGGHSYDNTCRQMAREALAEPQP